MSVQELKKAYEGLPEQDQLLFASLIAADQLARQADFVDQLEHRHQAMEQDKKWSHEQMLALHREL